MAITERESEQINQANDSGKTPVVFIHGLWLLASSWDNWAQLFEDAGYSAVTPVWPDDPETVEEARANPDVFAKKTVGQITEHIAEVIGGLEKKPAVVGHSFGGAFTQMMAGRGLSAASVDKERNIPLLKELNSAARSPRQSKRSRAVQSDASPSRRSSCLELSMDHDLKRLRND